MTAPDLDPVGPRLLTVKQVAERLQTNPYNVREWIRRKRLRATQPFGTWLIREDDLEALLRERSNLPNGEDDEVTA
jgi:excisionase family DNA binding protein